MKAIMAAQQGDAGVGVGRQTAEAQQILQMQQMMQMQQAQAQSGGGQPGTRASSRSKRDPSSMSVSGITAAMMMAQSAHDPAGASAGADRHSFIAELRKSQ